MNRQQHSNEHYDIPDNPRWLFIALATIAIHQIHSLIAEPHERRFRLTALTLLSFMPLTLLLPRRIRGMLWTLGGLPAMRGAIGGHLLSMIRNYRVPPATGTAAFNLAGGTLLSALGISLVLSPPSRNQP